MRTIGRTEEGRRIVEMSEWEYESLARLSMTIEGVTLEHLQAERPTLANSDLSTTIAAVRYFTYTKALINSLRSILNQMDEALTEREKESK